MINIIKGSIRGYDTEKARLIAIHKLSEQGYNYFVAYRDTKSEYALMYGNANWVKPPYVHVDGGYPERGLCTKRGKSGKSWKRKHPSCPNPKKGN